MTDDDPPIVCTLAGEARPAREAEFRELFSTALVAGERTERGLRLRFRADAGVEGKVRTSSAARRSAALSSPFTSPARAIRSASTGRDRPVLSSCSPPSTRSGSSPSSPTAHGALHHRPRVGRLAAEWPIP